MNKPARGQSGCDDAAARLDALLHRYCGVSLAWVDGAKAAQLRERLGVLDRRLVRERNKGVARHWSYDLNRHIALKQARDLISEKLSEAGGAHDHPGASPRRPAGQAAAGGARPKPAIASRVRTSF